MSGVEIENGIANVCEREGGGIRIETRGNDMVNAIASGIKIGIAISDIIVEWGGLRGRRTLRCWLSGAV
jgi:hypothetical protein